MVGRASWHFAPEAEIAEMRRGMVFQQPTLMPWLPVWENVAFRLRLKNVRKKQRRIEAQRYIDIV